MKILAPLHILAVEDNVVILKMLEMMIKSWKDVSIQLDTAHDGVEALACLEARATRFDLILTDVNMPRMSGLELLARLREMKIDTPVIILTGSALLDRVERDATTRQGTVQVLHKPVSSVVLRKAIARVISEHKLMLAPVAEDRRRPPQLQLDEDAHEQSTVAAATNSNRKDNADAASSAKSGA
jgi:two-component system response regulator ResD